MARRIAPRIRTPDTCYVPKIAKRVDGASCEHPATRGWSVVAWVTRLKRLGKYSENQWGEIL